MLPLPFLFSFRRWIAKFGVANPAMNINAGDTVDYVVSGSICAAKVLSRHGIDFCCEGSKSLKDACAEAGVSLRKLLREISVSESYRKDSPADLSSLNIGELTRYIESYHHHYTEENITFIRTSLERLVLLSGEQHPELVEIKNIFEELTGPLMVHMQHEEFIVFPYIRQLVKKGKPARSGMYRSVNSPIPGMLIDHDKGTAFLRKLNELTHHYEAPAKGGNAFKITYAAMRDLEKDLHAHLALEHDVLFPKALELEVRLSNLTWPSLPVAQTEV